MFEFRFLDNNISSDDNITESVEGSNTEPEWFDAKEIEPNLNYIVETVKKVDVNIFKCGKNTNIKHVGSNIKTLLCNTIKNGPILNAETEDSDLLTGVYEGGLKIWECTYDLANYISDEHLELKNKNVLDLGCGAGVIGIIALVNSSNVDFQDYNEEIIKYLTILNVYLNIDNEFNRCKFYAGDWNSYLTLTEKHFEIDDNKFDYIFTCETIYNPSNYKKLHAVFKQRLKRDGVIYLAAKTHYFGVGGGLRQFEEFVSKEGIFNFSTCWKCSEGLQREILKLTFK